MKSMIKISIRFVMVICMTVFFVGIFSYAAHQEKAFGATSYPVIKSEGLKATLSKNYSFKSPNYSGDYTGSTTKYAYIYRNGKKYVKFKLTESKRMTCIGKYNGKYYFNVDNGYRAIGVYSYKLGSKKFKRVCKNMNFESFKKSYRKYAYDKRHSGIINNRYILARKWFPTDGYGGYGNFYVYDLKKNTKKSLGSARDVILIGKKIYWTTTNPYDWLDSEAPKIVVKSSSSSGKNITTLKEIPFGDLNAGYGVGFIDNHYVTWQFSVYDDYGEYLGNETIKEQYR